MEKTKLFLSSHVEVVDIDGTDYAFRPLRVRALMTARDVIKEMTKAMSTLLDPSEDSYVESEYIQSDDGGSKTTHKAISPELADHRARSQAERWEKAVDALLSDANAHGVATLILDSMREEEITSEEFIKEVDLPRLGALLKAVFLANTKVFGPLPGKVQEALDKMKEKVVGASDEESPESEKPGTS